MPIVRPHPADLVAGLSTALIAIPQALAYAELAGMPAYTGLYALALPAVGAALFASSPHLQTGPVALTALLTLGALATLALPGSPEYVALAALLALLVGVIRLLVGVLRLGRIAFLLAQPVLVGFMSAAGILIIASQLPTALGVAPPVSGVLPRALWALVSPGGWTLSAAGLALLTLVVMRLGRRLHPLFPSVLVAVVLGIGLSLWLGWGGTTIGVIPAGIPGLQLELPWRAVPTLLVSAGIIALVGFADVASIARTYATQDRRRWDADREFISQGVANSLAGLFGGFPVGASFSRSAVNRMSGARTRWSGAVTGLAVLAFLPFVDLIAPLPRSVLAGIVIAAVLGLVRLGRLVELIRLSRPQAAIGWATFALTLGLAPRVDVAVLIGISLAIAQHLRREQRLIIEHAVEGGTLGVKPLGVLWFGSAARLHQEITTLLSEQPEVEVLELYLGGLGRIDLSGALMLEQLMNDARAAGLTVTLHQVPPMAKRWAERIWTDPPKEA